MSQRPAEGDRGKPRVQTAARTVAILLEVAANESGLTAKQICERVEIRQATAYHLLHTLVETKALSRIDRRYVLGLRMGNIANGFAQQLATERDRSLAQKVMRETRQSSHLSGWRLDAPAVLAATPEPTDLDACEAALGEIDNPHARADGKLLLARATPETRQRFLRSQDLERLTPNTKTHPAELESEFEKIRMRGYSEDVEEFALGRLGIAVPLGESATSKCLSIAGERVRFLKDRKRNLSTLFRISDAEVRDHE
jgi:DNA-binding IclR family transcriptional regulator